MTKSYIYDILSMGAVRISSVTKGGSIFPSQGGEQSMSVMEVLTLILVITNIVALVVTICDIKRK